MQEARHPFPKITSLNRSGKSMIQSSVAFQNKAVLITFRCIHTRDCVKFESIYKTVKLVQDAKRQAYQLSCLIMLPIALIRKFCRCAR